MSVETENRPNFLWERARLVKSVYGSGWNWSNFLWEGGYVKLFPQAAGQECLWEQAGLVRFLQQQATMGLIKQFGAHSSFLIKQPF